VSGLLAQKCDGKGWGAISERVACVLGLSEGSEPKRLFIGVFCLFLSRVRWHRRLLQVALRGCCRAVPAALALRPFCCRSSSAAGCAPRVAAAGFPGALGTLTELLGLGKMLRFQFFFFSLKW